MRDNALVLSEPRLQYVLLPADLVADADLDTFDKMTYAALDSFRNGASGLCCPSITTLARRAGISRRRIFLSLERLQRREWVIITLRHRRPSLYRLPWREALSAATGAPHAPRGARRAPKLVHGVHSNYLNLNQTKSTSSNALCAPDRNRPELEAGRGELNEDGLDILRRIALRKGEPV